MTDPKYAAFTALDPFFDIVQQGLAGLVDGDHYFDTIADDAEKDRATGDYMDSLAAMTALSQACS